MILGLWRRLREQGPSIVELYVAGTLGILTVYWIDNIRYFVPIFGIMMLWTAEGAVAMANGYLGSRKWRWTPVAVGLLIVCGLIGTLVNRPRRPVEQGVLNPGFLAAVRYVHTLPDTVRISFNNPRLLALYTNHLTAWFPKGSPEQVLQFLDNVGITHVVIIQEGDDDRYLGGAIRQFPQRFRAIFKEANCEIFEVRPAAS
jgi:hypothetical protein